MTVLNRYARHQTVTVYTSTPFSLPDGTPTDPTGVTLKVQAPDLTEQTYTYAGAQVIRDGVGSYHKDIAGDQVGTYTYQWLGTGAVNAAYEGAFVIDRSEFA